MEQLLNESFTDQQKVEATFYNKFSEQMSSTSFDPISDDDLVEDKIESKELFLNRDGANSKTGLSDLIQENGENLKPEKDDCDNLGEDKIRNEEMFLNKDGTNSKTELHDIDGTYS